MRKIPDSLINLQQRQREQTITTIKTAVQELQAEGYPITVKHLCERTGLSRSVFSKPHVQAVLDELKLSLSPAKTIPDVTLEYQYANWRNLSIGRAILGLQTFNYAKLYRNRVPNANCFAVKSILLCGNCVYITQRRGE